MRIRGTWARAHAHLHAVEDFQLIFNVYLAAIFLRRVLGQSAGPVTSLLQPATIREPSGEWAVKHVPTQRAAPKAPRHFPKGQGIPRVTKISISLFALPAIISCLRPGSGSPGDSAPCSTAPRGSLPCKRAIPDHTQAARMAVGQDHAPTRVAP